MDFFDFDEYDQLLEAAKTLDPRYHTFVLAAGDAGMRAGEIRGLWWERDRLQEPAAHGGAGGLARSDHDTEARQAADDPDDQAAGRGPRRAAP